MNTNVKSLIMKVKTSELFSISISGFVFAATLFFRLRERITITILPSFITQMVTVLRTGKTNLTIVLKQTGQLVTIINSKKISLAITVSELGKLVATMMFKNPIGFISSALQKITTTMSTGKLGLATTVILATFFTLGTYDPTTLGTQDVKTLGAMDYTV